MPRLARHLCHGAAGSFLVALAVVVFLSPNQIATGGPPGIAIILFHLYGINQGATLFVINAVLLIVGARLLGGGYLLRTAYAIACTAIFMELLTWAMPDPAVTDAPLLNALYGGSLVGAGLALVYMGEAAAGGWSLLARVIANRLRLPVGQVILALDAGVILASAIAFRDIESSLWAGIGVYVTGLVVDLALTGRVRSKMVQISTRMSGADLAARLASELSESGAMVHCSTLRDMAGRDLMLFVADASQVGKLSGIVHAADPEARIAILDAAEFLVGAAQPLPDK
ncbi:YitT family protein [Castellaniella sp.]|uniref:YitT family protein n=1 Tax=Castellaniella sp. TaxID=1955812 RepID=UPI002AFF9580|nr:YitT family protein [Castellaniella sp.]